MLVVEDNVDAAQSLKKALEADTHIVNVAFSGPEGIEKGVDAPPDVVVCDIGLPGLDRYGVADALRSGPSLSWLFLIALSGNAAPDDFEKSREAGLQPSFGEAARLGRARARAGRRCPLAPRRLVPSKPPLSSRIRDAKFISRGAGLLHQMEVVRPSANTSALLPQKLTWPSVSRASPSGPGSVQAASRTRVGPARTWK